MVASLVGSFLASHFQMGPKAAFVLTPALAASFVVYAVRTRDGFVARMILFGLVVGFGELPADYFGVAVNKTLVYPQAEPLIWVSPAYMPLSWMVMMLQLGTVANWLTSKWGLLKTTAALAVLGGLNIPLYETLAHRAGWWSYRNTPMLFGVTPYYVILAEVLLSLALPLVVSHVAQARGPKVVALGVAQSVWLLLTGVFASWLVGLVSR
ncbi:MAG TPA: hypothetical protein VF794_26190 [Archangium sp.]|jgi:hypothetical protein|uniref:DUF6989 domain-containing protein n=1 Tax=Archangium sp. TaxID=1872627 RepID=UPI002EDA70E6